MITTKGTITGNASNSQSIQGKVAIGTLYILPDNIVTIEIVEELPVPTEEYRRHFRIVETDGIDNLYICLKNVDTFEWVNLSNRETETHECTYGEWTYNAETGQDERTCSECGNVETKTHEHDYQPGATIATEDPNDVCTKVPYTCAICGDVYYDDEVEHTWEEWWLDPAYEMCAGCGCSREKPTEPHEHAYSAWLYNEETSLDERGCFECDYRETRTHEHNHQPGAIITTKNPNDYCEKTSNPCTCGDVYYTEEKEHQWVEDWLDPNLEECTNCHIFRDKPTE